MGLEDFNYNCLGVQIAAGFVGFDKTSPYTKAQNFYSVPSILAEVTVIHPEQSSVMGASLLKDTQELSMKTVAAVHAAAMDVFLFAA